jgi:cytochrome c peroxidase
LAPPPNQPTDEIERLQQGAAVFVEAGCAECHSGRFFTNNQIIPLDEIGTNPSRAEAQLEFSEVFVEPRTYAPSEINPIQEGARILTVPLRGEIEERVEMAYEQGGYKVVTLIGIYLHAPYLHEASIAAGPDALRLEGERYVVADETQIGVMGTTERFLRPDPAASLRFLLDRQLRQQLIWAYGQYPQKQRAHITGEGHEFWVDEEAGYTFQQQNDLILFLLSLDDDPEVLP